jgi:hypothetical protein
VDMRGSLSFDSMAWNLVFVLLSKGAAMIGTR